MNMHARELFVDGLMGVSRAAQRVGVVTSIYNGSHLGPRHIVLIIPEGHKRGNYYECGDRPLALMRSGMSPEDLELEPLTDDECEAVDDGSYWEL